jgi:hydrogenase small subunit
MKLSQFNLVWLTGPSCDGCTIRALGDRTAGGIEALLTGAVEGLPKVRLYHSALSFETGDAFVDCLRSAERGELDPFGLVVEASVPDDTLAHPGFYAAEGEEEGTPITVARWLDRLAPRAVAVIAWGDCGAFGGPHTNDPNPTGATGAWTYLGIDYKSRLGAPVINLPGCAAPPVLTTTLIAVLKWLQGEGDLPELDDTNRPKFAYPDAGSVPSVVRD